MKLQEREQIGIICNCT